MTDCLPSPRCQQGGSARLDRRATPKNEGGGGGGVDLVLHRGQSDCQATPVRREDQHEHTAEISRLDSLWTVNKSISLPSSSQNPTDGRQTKWSDPIPCFRRWKRKRQNTIRATAPLQENSLRCLKIIVMQVESEPELLTLLWPENDQQMAKGAKNYNKHTNKQNLK